METRVDEIGEGIYPTTLACMHGSWFSGDGGQALLDLATAYETAFPA